MKKKLLLFILGFAGCFSNGLSQQLYMLDSCLQYAMAGHPVNRDYFLLDRVFELKMNNFTSQYYPRLELSAQATYQSDVTSVDVDLPLPGVSFPRPDRDQYRISLDVNQVVYDGGLTRRQRAVEASSLEAMRSEVAVSLYRLKEAVNKVYFSLLLLQEKEQVVRLMGSVLGSRLETARTAYENGVITRADLLGLEVEVEKLDQQLLEIRYGRSEGLAVLSELIHRKVNESDSLVLPGEEWFHKSQGGRPETGLFSRQREVLRNSSGLLDSQRNPKLFVFGQLGYGRPGLNMLSEEFDTYYILGARLSWNVFDWGRVRREKEVLRVQSDRITNREESFAQDLGIQLASEMASAGKYRDLLEHDQSIIQKRAEISESAGSGFINGTISGTEYLAVLNAEKEARINRKIHEVLFLQHQANVKLISGN